MKKSKAKPTAKDRKRLAAKALRMYIKELERIGYFEYRAKAFLYDRGIRIK